MIRFVPDTAQAEIKITAFDGDEYAGKCSFTVDGYFMDFVSVECSDDLITEGLARAAMNCAANRSVYIARIKKELSSQAFERLGFAGEETLSVEIPQALGSGCCSCNNK